MFKYYILLFPKSSDSFRSPTHFVIRAFTKSYARRKFMSKNTICSEEFICEIYTKSELSSVGIESKCDSYSKELILKEDEDISRKVLLAITKDFNTKKFYDYLETKTDAELLRLGTETTHFGIIFIRQLYLNQFKHPLYRSIVCMLGDALENAPFSLANLKSGNQRVNLSNFIVDFYMTARKYEDIWNEAPHSNFNFDIIAQEIFKPKYMNLFEIKTK